MRRSHLHRRRGLGRYPSARRTVSVNALDNFQCPNCGHTKVTWSNKGPACAGCWRLIRITNYDPRDNASITESDRGEFLRDLQAAGLISDLKDQVPVPLPYLNKSGTWTCDYAYVDDTKRQIYEDAKGHETELFGVLRRLWPDFGPGILRIAKRGGVRKWAEEDIEGRKGT